MRKETIRKARENAHDKLSSLFQIFQGQDILETLRTSIKFFENVEPSKDDPVRAEREREAGPGFRRVLEKVESDVASEWLESLCRTFV